MRKIFMNIAAVLLGGAALVACSVKENGSDTLGKKEIKFTASVGQFETKADAAAQAVGLYVLDTRQEYFNERLEIAGNTLVPEKPLYWDPEMYIEDFCRFVAYYPYDALRENLWDAFAVQKDQSTPEAFEASDLLVALTQSAPVEGPVHLSFVHMFSRIIVTVDNLLDSPIKDVYMAGVCTETRPYSDWAFYSDLPTNYDSRTDVKMLPVLLEEGAPAWAVIIPHQDFEAALKVVTADGEEYTITGNRVYLNAGSSYTASAVLDGSSSTLEFSTEIASWNEGWSTKFDNQTGVEETSWGICGDMTGWADGYDIPMIQDQGYQYGYYIEKVELYSKQGFKFRKNNSWADGDLGYDADWDGTMHYIAEGQTNLRIGGPDLYVPVSGVWSLWVDTAYNYLYATLIDAYEDPEDPPQETDYWGVVGTFNDWGSNPDIVMDHNEPYWTTQIVLKKDAQFKFRMNDAWVNDLGVDSDDYGTSHYISTGSVLSLRAGGANLVSPVHGLWSLMLNPEKGILEVMLMEEYPDDPDPEDPEEPFTGWSVIGSMDGTSWGVDYDLNYDPDYNFYYIEIYLAEGDEFKFRKGHDWTVNYGYDSFGDPYLLEDILLTGPGIEVPSIPLSQGGANFEVPASGLWTLELYPDDAMAYIYRIK